jgi:hypothetical protein
MKNLYIYINPAKRFTNPDWHDEADVLIKIQIDNSLALGWKREDIILVTNFHYHYNGVTSIEVGDENYVKFSSGTPSKINVLCTMFKQGLIEDEKYFFHDLDAFQLEPITWDELEIERGQIGITTYGYIKWSRSMNHRWSTGVIFFDNQTEDIFNWIKASVYKYQANEEVSLLVMTRHNDHDLKSRIKVLNITYNMATRRRAIDKCYELATKPLKVLHFHPFDTRPTSYGGNNLEVLMYGKNSDNRVFLPDRLINIFKEHNIK